MKMSLDFENLFENFEWAGHSFQNRVWYNLPITLSWDAHCKISWSILSVNKQNKASLSGIRSFNPCLVMGPGLDQWVISKLFKEKNAHWLNNDST